MPQLTVEGHDVCVIDRDPDARELLAGAFPGQFLVGSGYSRRILTEAGIDTAAAFVAVTSGDNTDIVGARIAKEYYQVPQVVARIYHPRRADIYHDLGISTVASVRWTATLESSGALTSDLLLAATGEDEDNLVVALLAKQQFAVPGTR